MGGLLRRSAYLAQDRPAPAPNPSLQSQETLVTPPMAAFTDNPFAVLTAVVAPAVLTNACSVLALGTANRIARVVDRTRVVSAHFATLSPDPAEHAAQMRQLERLRGRAQMLLRALRLFYASLGSFASSALISVIGSALAVFEQRIAFHVAAVIGLAIGRDGLAGGLLDFEFQRLGIVQPAAAGE